MLFDEHALQLSAYRRGEVILFDDGSEAPLQPTDGGAVLQLRPNGYLFRPVVTDETVYSIFLALLMSASWTFEHGHETVLVRAFPRQTLPGLSAPPKKKAQPKKATGKRLAQDPPIGRAVEEVQLPLGPVSPLKTAAVNSSAILRSLRGRNPEPPPHPDSPVGDEIPF